jgi:hypothetical protein
MALTCGSGRLKADRLDNEKAMAMAATGPPRPVFSARTLELKVPVEMTEDEGLASTAVRKLEEDGGVRLLHRTTRSVQLTEDGRAFHARARDLLAEVEERLPIFVAGRSPCPSS